MDSQQKTSWIPLLLLIVVVGAGFYYKDPLLNLVQTIETYFQPNPCDKPITYSINSLDPRFGLSKQDFLDDLSRAATIWEGALNRPLFRYVAQGGEVSVNLVYDQRQEATVEQQQIGSLIDSKRTAYESLKSEFDSEKASYEQQKNDLQTKIDQYNTEKSSYEEEVSYWNSKGGAPSAEYAKLQNEKQSLDSQASAINSEEQTVNDSAARLNQTVNDLNAMIKDLNLNVATYNSTGDAIAPQFTEGEYVTSAAGKMINIYQYSNQDKLIRVLAHEMGHALGLQHINNPKAIMYYLNEGVNDKLTQDDIDELKSVCKIR